MLRAQQIITKDCNLESFNHNFPSSLLLLSYISITKWKKQTKIVEGENVNLQELDSEAATTDH